MSLERVIIPKLEPGSPEWRRVMEASVGKPKSTDPYIVSRGTEKVRYTRAEWENYRKKVLETPLP